MNDKPYTTLVRTPNEYVARKHAEFHAEPVEAELGSERHIIRVVKAPLWWEVRRYPYSWFRGGGG